MLHDLSCESLQRWHRRSTYSGPTVNVLLLATHFFLQVLPTILLLVTSKENGECRTPQYLIFGSQPRMLCEPDQGEGLHGLHDPLDDSHNDPRRLRPLAPANSMSASVLQSTVVEHLPGRLGHLL